MSKELFIAPCDIEAGDIVSCDIDNDGDMVPCRIERKGKVVWIRRTNEISSSR